MTLAAFQILFFFFFFFGGESYSLQIHGHATN